MGKHAQWAASQKRTTPGSAASQYPEAREVVQEILESMRDDSRVRVSIRSIYEYAVRPDESPEGGAGLVGGVSAPANFSAFKHWFYVNFRDLWGERACVK